MIDKNPILHLLLMIVAQAQSLPLVALLSISLLDNLHSRVRGEHFEDFADVDFGGAVGEAAVAEHGAERLALGDGFNDGFGDVFIKTGDQVAVVVGVDGAAVNVLGRVGHGERKSPFYQTAEQQVEVGAVALDIGLHHGEHILCVFARAEIDVVHVAVGKFQHTETGIQILCGQRAFVLDFLTGATDTLFADFADGGITSLISSSFVIAHFW